MNQKSAYQYDTLSRTLHWITAIAVTASFIGGPGGFGRLMRQGIDPVTRMDIVWHESLGMLVFALTVVRLLWIAFRTAAPLFVMAKWMQVLAKLMHVALWALMLALPMTAILALGSEAHPWTLLGGLRMDKMSIIAESAIADLADWDHLHQFLGDTIMWLAGLHAVATTYHHLLLKDGVLSSMLPRKWSRQGRM